MRFEFEGHTFEGESRENADGTVTIKGFAICGPHDEIGNHTEPKDGES